jgi:hypothetical protein
MWIFQLALISGVMVGLELRFLEKEEPYSFSLVIDLFIIRLILQKFKVCQMTQIKRKID